MAKEKVKKPFYKKIWVWVLAIIIVIAIANSGGEDTETASSDSSTDSSSEETTEETAETDEETEEVKTASIGEPSEVDSVTFTVNGVEETSEIDSGNEFTENATTSGKFVILDVTVENGQDEAITIDSSYFKLIADGAEFEPNTDGTVMMAMGDAMGDFFLEQINPSLEKTGKVVFEVGGDINVGESTLQAQTGMFGTATTEIQLSE